MNTKGFFDFYNTIYTYDKGKTVINALRNRKITFSHWAESMFKKRKNCEACIFTCFLENDKFKEQLVIYENRFKKSLSGYARSNRFSVEYDIKKNPRKFFERKYHEVRKRQIELILEYIEKVKNPNSTNPIASAEASVDNRPPHYTYTNIDKTILLFNFLVEKGYLLNPSQNDFVYYMTGEGEHPTSCLRWNMSKKKFTLSIFIKKMFGDEVNFWDTAEKIFGVKGLKTLYGSWKSRGEKPHEIIDFVLKL